MTTGSTKVYTRKGDTGSSSLFGGTPVQKDDPRLSAYGTLDELNSSIGVLISTIESHRWPSHSSIEISRVVTELLDLQRELFVLGSHLATETDNAAARARLPKLTDEAVLRMETWMDRMSVDLPELRRFILPGGNPPAAQSHFTRTIARRAERAVVSLVGKGPDEPAWLMASIRHLNRMNDYFFVLARHLNRLGETAESEWAP